MVLIDAPVEFDGYFLVQHILDETGVDLWAHGGLSFDSPQGKLRLMEIGLETGQISAIETAVGSYVHPGDTSKSLSDVMLKNGIPPATSI